MVGESTVVAGPRPPHRPPPPERRTAGDRVRGGIRVLGELLITLGIVVLLFAFYIFYVTSWISAGKQADVTGELEEQWRNPRGTVDRPLVGEGIAKLHIPALGPDYAFTVLEGTDQETLAAGPGHYVDTAMPGQPGNFALAGHRNGYGAPFLNLDLLESCDALVVETRDTWLVYRVLPMADEMAGWADGKGATQRCQGVNPLPAPYREVPGREIVQPSQTEVIAPMAGDPDAQLPPQRQAKLITLTTCHPKFSARQRLIIYGVLVAQHPKDGTPPAVLTQA
jgi:sortase A